MLDTVLCYLWPGRPFNRDGYRPEQVNALAVMVERFVHGIHLGPQGAVLEAEGLDQGGHLGFSR